MRKLISFLCSIIVALTSCSSTKTVSKFVQPTTSDDAKILRELKSLGYIDNKNTTDAKTLKELKSLGYVDMDKKTDEEKNI